MLGNILHSKSIRAKIPLYFDDQYVPIISDVQLQTYIAGSQY